MNKRLHHYTGLSDAELQALVHQGNDCAFQALYDRYWDIVLTTCQRRVQQLDVAQDLVQDIFLSLWNHHDLRTVLYLRAYLLQSCKFAVIKYLHKSARYDSVDNIYVGHLDRIQDVDLEEALDSKMIHDLLFEQVDRLPNQTRLIFNYSRKDQLSSKEIADKLHISPRTVENQISKALKQLRKFLQKGNILKIF